MSKSVSCASGTMASFVAVLALGLVAYIKQHAKDDKPFSPQGDSGRLLGV